MTISFPSRWPYLALILFSCILFSSPVRAAEVGFDTLSTLATESSGTIGIRVRQSGATVFPVRARVRVSGGTAIAGTDFSLLTTELVFEDLSDTLQVVQLVLFDDLEERNGCYVMLELFDITGAGAGKFATHAVLIADDDVPPLQPSGAFRLRLLSSLRTDTLSNVSAEVSAFDPASRRLFVTNGAQNTIEIFDLSDPVRPLKWKRLALAPYGGNVNYVAVQNGVFAVAVEAIPPTARGKVVFLDPDGNLISQVVAGHLPEMLRFTPDGRYLLVANEGEPEDFYAEDPPGSISLIDLSAGFAGLGQQHVTEIDFTSFDGQEAALNASGIRIYGPGAAASEDIEPEYVAISSDGSTAYVVLQENNALAVVDLADREIRELRSFGLKDWMGGRNTMDASDRSDGIFFGHWPVKSYLQPDGIQVFEHQGERFLIGACEGELRQYNAINEGVRLASPAYPLDPVLFPDAHILKNEALLGRLMVSNAFGDTDGDGDFDEIHAFGGRSVAIWRADDGQLVWDSGDDLERITASFPLFNANFNNNRVKNRSDDNGPEPEDVLVIEMEGHRLAFVSLERTGGLVLYDISDPTAPQWVSYINTRTLEMPGGDLGPEGILHIPASDSPTRKDLIVLCNEASGTLAVFELTIDRTRTGEYLLDKVCFQDLPLIGVTQGKEIREGGFSGLAARDGSYFLISDRGPNLEAFRHPAANGQAVKVFPFPDYAPKLWQVQTGSDQLDLLGPVARPDGSPASGLPLPPGSGSTGEIGWLQPGGPVLPPDIWGLDAEGIALDNEGHYWLCDEYGSSIWHLDPQGKLMRRYTPFPTQADDAPVDPSFGKREPNRGFEGISYTPEGKIYAILQSPAANPDTMTAFASRIHRILELDTRTGEQRMFAYEHSEAYGSLQNRDWKVGDLTAINNQELLLIEHATRDGWYARNLVRIDLSQATPIPQGSFNGNTLEELLDAQGMATAGLTPVQRTLLADLAELGWDPEHEKPEGIVVLSDSVIALVNDNDYGIFSPGEDGWLEHTDQASCLYTYVLPETLRLPFVEPYCRLDLPSEYAICEGDTAVIDLSLLGFANAVWSDGQSGPAAFFAQSGYYTVVAETDGGCLVRDSFFVEVTGGVSVDLGPDLVLCQGDTVELVAGIPNAIYVWSTGQNIPQISVVQSGVYFLTVFQGPDCFGSDTIAVDFKPGPDIDLGDDLGICPGQGVLIGGGEPGWAYQWSNGLLSQFQLVEAPGLYAVTATDALGCRGSDSLLVTGLPSPVFALGPDTVICEGDVLILDVSDIEGTYLWSTGSVQSVQLVSEAGEYRVTITNEAGCAATDQITVEVEICLGGLAFHGGGGLVVYPNPVHTWLYVDTGGLVAPRGCRFRLHSSSGQLVADYGDYAVPVRLDLSGFARGTYWLEVGCKEYKQAFCLEKL